MWKLGWSKLCCSIACRAIGWLQWTVSFADQLCMNNKFCRNFYQKFLPRISSAVDNGMIQSNTLLHYLSHRVTWVKYGTECWSFKTVWQFFVQMTASKTSDEPWSGLMLEGGVALEDVEEQKQGKGHHLVKVCASQNGTCPNCLSLRNISTKSIRVLQAKQWYVRGSFLWWLMKTLNIVMMQNELLQW